MSTTYTNASGTTFQHDNKKLSTRGSSGFKQEYNFTLHIRGDDLAHIQKTRPDITNKAKLQEYVREKLQLPNVEAPAPAVAEAIVPALAVAQADEVKIPELPKAKAKKPEAPAVVLNKALLSYIKARHDQNVKLYDIKQELLTAGNTKAIAEAHMIEFEKTLEL